MKKIKVFICLLVVITVIIVGVLFLNKPNYYKTKLPFAHNDGKLMGIIQIGGSDEDYDYSIVEKYFTTNDFETIEFGGTEKYLIVPRSYDIQVYSLELTEDGGLKETFIKSMSEPFYITCNMSDIIANSLLRIKNDSKQYSYSPYISLKDGSLVVEDFVLHIK